MQCNFRSKLFHSPETQLHNRKTEFLYQAKVQPNFAISYKTQSKFRFFCDFENEKQRNRDGLVIPAFAGVVNTATGKYEKNSCWQNYSILHQKLAKHI